MAEPIRNDSQKAEQIGPESFQKMAVLSSASINVSGDHAMTFRRGLFYWLAAGIGLALAVLVMNVAVEAQNEAIGSAYARIHSINPVAAPNEDGLQVYFVRAKDVARLIGATLEFTEGSQTLDFRTSDANARFLLGSRRYLITGEKKVPVSGYLPAPIVMHEGILLLSRKAAVSFLDSFESSAGRSDDSRSAVITLLPPAAIQTPVVVAPRTVAPTKPTAVAVTTPTNKPGQQQIPKPTVAPKPKLASFIRNIVIDAGHGAHDGGALGRGGTKEKDVNLAVAVLLAKKLQKRTAGKVTLTRAKDVFLSLDERVKVAKKNKADLFISIHSNAISGDRGRYATGTEVYFFSEPSDADAKRLERGHGGSFNPTQAGIDPILWNLMLIGNVVESNKLARIVSTHLPRKVGLRNRGVKSARFHVLHYGVVAAIPSILIELGFLSNPEEERKLNDRAWQIKASAAISDAICEYLEDLEARYPKGKNWPGSE